MRDGRVRAGAGTRAKNTGRSKARAKAARAFWVTAAILIIAGVMVGKDFYMRGIIPHLDEIKALCLEMGEDPALVLAMIQTESSFRQDVVSPRGAVGLMQVMPDTGRWVAGRIGLKEYSDSHLQDRHWNMIIGISYIQYLQREFGGSLPQAIAAYNAGPTRVHGWLDAGEWDGSNERVNDIPYKETRNYVKKVLKAYSRYRWLRV